MTGILPWCRQCGGSGVAAFTFNDVADRPAIADRWTADRWAQPYGLGHQPTPRTGYDCRDCGAAIPPLPPPTPEDRKRWRREAAEAKRWREAVKQGGALVAPGAGDEAEDEEPEEPAGPLPGQIVMEFAG